MPTDQAGILYASQALLQLLTPGDLDATLRSITRAAVEVLPQVQFASSACVTTTGPSSPTR